MKQIGLYGKFITHEGQRDALVEILLEAAREMETVDGCYIYIVNISDEEPNSVWVTEVWRDAEAHAASLQNEETRRMIQLARPLIAGIEQNKLRPLGGKGM